MYQYRATVVSVYDADTVTVDVDLGFNIWVKGEKVRLARINAPEVRGKERPQGLVSRDWLRERLLNKDVIIETKKDKKGKFGRYIVEIHLDGVCINDQLVQEGLAEYKEY